MGGFGRIGQQQITNELLIALAHTLAQEARRDLYDDQGNLAGSDDEIAERMTAVIRRVDSISSKIGSALQGA